MPVYVYECKECGNKFEKMQPITADPIKDCPNCGKSSVRRVFQPVGVIFKGSGWYITDSRKSGSEEGSTKATTPEKSEKSEAVGDKSEAKSEAKSDAPSSSSESTAPAAKSVTKSE